MRAACCKATVLSHSAPAADIRLLRVLWPDPGHAPHAGQFFTLRSWGAEEAPFLSRPISVHKWEPETLTVSFLYQIVGQGTARLAALKEGDALQLTGPMGNGFDVPDIAARYEKIALVGGGIGVPPLLGQAAFTAKNSTAVLGFRSADRAMLGEDYRDYCEAVYLCSDDGSLGRHGFVDALVRQELSEDKNYDAVLACGPKPMLRNVAKVAQEFGVPCQVSMEERMGCGIGAYLVCVCDKTDGAHARVCKDGPVFEIGDVVL